MGNLRFKFRAYDEKQKIIHLDFEFISSGQEHNDWIIFKSDKQQLKDKVVFDNPYFYKQFKIMQFTGLFDKQGVEIYEGDIVVYDDTSYNAHTSILTGVIKMENLSFKLISIKPDSLGYRKMLIGSDDFFSRKSQVIGNIYENKELLTHQNRS